MAGVDAGTHVDAIGASVLAEGIHAAGSDAGDLTIAKSTTVIQWQDPAPISEGTALGPTQLNAAANVPGAFVYSPAAGTVLGEGTHTLAVQFTPTDQVNYETVTATAALVVEPASSQCAINVTGSAAVQRGGFRLHRATSRYVQAVTLTNTGAVPIQAPVSLVVDELSAGVTLYGPQAPRPAARPRGRHSSTFRSEPMVC